MSLCSLMSVWSAPTTFASKGINTREDWGLLGEDDLSGVSFGGDMVLRGCHSYISYDAPPVAEMAWLVLLCLAGREIVGGV